MDENASAPESEHIQILLRRFEAPLLQFAARIIGDRERARDVVQETFVKYQQNGASLRQPSPATWLFTVCRNKSLNVCRKESRLLFLGEEIVEPRQAEEPTPYEQLEKKEAGGFLLRIVATLPPRQQEVLQLKFQNDLSYQEIAEITKTSANNVGVLIHSALKTLRQRYAHASKEFLPFQPRTT